MGGKAGQGGWGAVGGGGEETYVALRVQRALFAVRAHLQHLQNVLQLARLFFHLRGEEQADRGDVLQREEPGLKAREEPGLKVHEEPGLKAREEPGLKVCTNNQG